MAINLLELLGMVFGIGGMIFNVYKSKWGYVVWIVSNLLWIVYAYNTKQYFFLLQYIVFTIVLTWGFIKWNKEEKEIKKK